MEPKQILSANLLDIIFDNRNKAYGAYELRITYPERIKKSLLVVFIFVALAITGLAWANSSKPKEPGRIETTPIELSQIEPEVKEPEPLPEPERRPEPPQVQTQQFTEFKVVPEDVETPVPTQDDLDSSRIDVFTREGIVDDGTAEIKMPVDNKGIIESQKADDDNTIYPVVQIPARYDGNWQKFLLRNLDPEVPINNGAPAGRYTVLIQFVVDKEGNVSDLAAMTSHGYGMEEEAMRVLKKAKDWKAGIQNGREVKSYHKQPITFEVMSEQ